MIAGLPVCHPATKSSPSRPTTVLSDLIMSRIKSRGRGTALHRRPALLLFVTMQHKTHISFLHVEPFVYDSVHTMIEISGLGSACRGRTKLFNVKL